MDSPYSPLPLTLPCSQTCSCGTTCNLQRTTSALVKVKHGHPKREQTLVPWSRQAVWYKSRKYMLFNYVALVVNVQCKFGLSFALLLQHSCSMGIGWKLHDNGINVFLSPLCISLLSKTNHFSVTFSAFILVFGLDLLC